MSAGIRAAARQFVMHKTEFKKYRSEFFCEAADIYVDLHLGLRILKYANHHDYVAFCDFNIFFIVQKQFLIET